MDRPQPVEYIDDHMQLDEDENHSDRELLQNTTDQYSDNEDHSRGTGSRRVPRISGTMLTNQPGAGSLMAEAGFTKATEHNRYI